MKLCDMDFFQDDIMFFNANIAGNAGQAHYSPLAGPEEARDPRAQVAEQRRLERDLRDAVKREAFHLHYQPRLALASGEANSAEALIRWPHRRRGVVPPMSFIPLAERNGLILPIGAWVLRTACQEAAGWGRQDVSGLSLAVPSVPVPTVSVNVSARQIADGVLLHQVAAALEASGLPPERLELELTESMLIQIDLDALLGLSALRDIGIGLALDDFGIGYASLAMLRRLPLTVLKLDRSLIHGLPHEREDAAIVRAVVETSHALGLRVVAEGIETAEQRDYLTQIGCDEGQGFLFSRPIGAEKLRQCTGFAAG